MDRNLQKLDVPSGRNQRSYGATSSVDNGSADGGGEREDSQEFSDLPPDPVTVLQACVFIEDALNYRAIDHRVDVQTLRWYRKYYSKAAQWLLYSVIVVIHMLAFFETPSSLSITADIRKNVQRVVIPCGITECIEIICLLILLADLSAKAYFRGFHKSIRSKWLLAYAIVIIASILDWMVSIGMICTYAFRLRRMVRPFFLLQNSSLMKKTVNSLRRTMSQLFSVLLLLFIHLYFFTLFGMLLFPQESNNSGSSNSTKTEDNEYGSYFYNLVDSFMNLLILLTTANNPDVSMPAYNVNRFYAIFFIAFLVIGLYCLMNMLTAVIYNQFRGYFLNSMQASLFRRRLGVRAAFEVLRRRRITFKHSSSLGTASEGVPSMHVRIVVEQCQMWEVHKRALYSELDTMMYTVLSYAQFMEVFVRMEEDVTNRNTQTYVMREMHSPIAKMLQKIFSSKYFVWFGCFVAIANVICISIVNLVLIPYYLVEQCLRIWALGIKKYCSDRGNVLDGFITVILVIVEMIYLVMYGIPYWGQDRVVQKSIKLWDLVRIINMLIMVKLLRMITSQYKAMFVVMSTMADLLKNLKAFAGLLFVAYYSYAILGMMLFQDKIIYMDIINSSLKNNGTFKCGTYEQLEYWSNNFDDFAAALVVLWDVMVVNNWHVFLHAYTRAVNKWSQIYFIVWWLISVVIALNLFTALILENFIMRWDRTSQANANVETSSIDRASMMESFRTEYLTVHDMFRGDLQEPSEESLIVELRQHPFLSLSS